jgi:xanthine dehydrogenase YagR molybdenum-binding subunit
MKFETPATTNPIDQLKVIGRRLDRIDGPLKTRARHSTPTSATTSRPTSSLRLCRRLGIAKGRIASMDLRPARPRPGVLARDHGAQRRQVRQG